MYSTAHQTATCPSSHEEDRVIVKGPGGISALTIRRPWNVMPHTLMHVARRSLNQRELVLVAEGHGRRSPCQILAARLTRHHDLETWVRGHSRSFKSVLFESLGAVSYWPSIVTMALSCIICEIKRDNGRKSWFFHTPLHLTPPLGGTVGILPSSLVRKN